jgi:soluble lytic murein transglycosylase-like protein
VTVLAARRRAASPRDGRVAEATRLAGEIVSAAHLDAERIRTAAAEAAAVRERELVERVEALLVHGPPSPSLEAEARAVRLQAAADERAREIRAEAERTAGRVLSAAQESAHELVRRAERRQRRREEELRQLSAARDQAVRELADRIARLESAGVLIGFTSHGRNLASMLRRSLVIAAGLVVAGAAVAAVWLPTTFSHSTPPPKAVAAPSVSLCPIPSNFRSAFVTAARREDIPLPLLVSVATVESQFDRSALSTTGAIGLLQLMPATASDLRVDPRSPRANVLGGAAYLRQMLDQFGSIPVALAAYNAGPNAVRRGAVGPETLNYVAAVSRMWQAIEGCR